LKKTICDEKWQNKIIAIFSITDRTYFSSALWS